MKKSSDFLVIGSGIAGLCFAINAAKSGTVIVVTKKKDKESNTNYAQGGIASVLDPTDSFELHMRDTLSAGTGLCYKDAVKDGEPPCPPWRKSHVRRAQRPVGFA